MNLLRYVFNWKYRYFYKKLWGVYKMIADLEFKRFKTLEIREEIRQTYNEERNRLDVLEAQIKSQKEKPTMEEGEIKRLDDKKVLLDRDIARHTEQMKSLDESVTGAVPTAENKEGVRGINQDLDALRELVGMVSQYIKREL